MIMNSTNYKQYDTRWAKLGYPKSPYFIKDCGCGEVAICNVIIETSKYANETPKTIQPYCKQFAAPNGNGTYFSGIPTMMKHYGLTEVKEHQTMAELWKELKKGGRVAIYLMGNRKGGSKGVHWTSSAHFVCSVDYKEKNGKHYVYVKDSNSTSSLRNGFISYEENMRNDVSRVWSGKLPKAEPAPTPTKSIDEIAKEVIDGKWGNGEERIAKLKASGYDPSEVQKKVNEIIESRKNIDQLAHEVIDGKWGSGDERKKRLTEAGYDYDAVQKRVNELLAPKEPTLTNKILAACKEQAVWSKNSKYKFQKNPTIAKSKFYETCVTYAACVGQRVKLIPSGKYIWHNSKGKVVGATGNFEIIYPKNKKLKDLKGVLKAGDFVMDGDKTDLKGGSHIFIITGEWKDGYPIVWDNHAAQGKKGKSYKYTRNRPVIAIARPKAK